MTDHDDDFTALLAEKICRDGEIITKHITIAEVMASNGSFELRFNSDGITDWDATGMLTFAADAYRGGQVVGDE